MFGLYNMLKNITMDNALRQRQKEFVFAQQQKAFFALQQQRAFRVLAEWREHQQGAKDVIDVEARVVEDAPILAHDDCAARQQNG